MFSDCLRFATVTISGHKTRAVFDRYNISSPDDRRKALTATQAYIAGQPTERKLVEFANAKEAAG